MHLIQLKYTFIYKYKEQVFSTFEKKNIPYTSAVHMPFKNAVIYILLYGTAESYCLQKALDKDCKVPTKRVWHPTRNKTSYYNSELNERLYANFFKYHLTIVYVPAYNIIILCLTN